jgi:hypothetical protein
MSKILLSITIIILSQQQIKSFNQDNQECTMKNDEQNTYAIYSYDEKEYRFSEEVRNMLGGIQRLEDIHHIQSSTNQTRVMGYSDRDDPLVRRFLNAFDSSYIFLYNYLRFVRNEIKPRLFNSSSSSSSSDERILVQRTPNIRFHRPGETTLGKRDTDPSTEIVGLHSDHELDHPSDEYNVIIPLTRMHGTNSIYFEPRPNSNIDPKDYESLNLNTSQFFVGYLNKMKHYNRHNQGESTRVSFDFRVKRGVLVDEDGRSSPTKNLKFVPGGYYMWLQ